ncbi:hypothetical protein PR003_g13817 [Phytophthora rubi]|uniref:Uncharacterized protein n=1 Tax=Phytophthora rubi TaxID=129364 RepID=A0A6A3KZK1_9STRA|nr:hypothetical protein PR001_g15567 [Phytophthora rubi]KAE9333864.1 hypothetical protein PR003_g13817 [Phytophthora rubi]
MPFCLAVLTPLSGDFGQVSRRIALPRVNGGAIDALPATQVAALRVRHSPCIVHFDDRQRPQR